MNKKELNKNVCVVIPFYKPQLDETEFISLKRCFEIFPNRHLILLGPEGIDASAYHLEKGRLQEIRMDKKYFKNVKSYSNLLTRSFFYKQFRAYDFMLIHQLDAFVFRDELDKWCNSGYKYVGAPWINARYYFRRAGNGGFSLRKVSAFYKTAKLFESITNLTKLNEDVIWANNPFSFTPLFKVANFDNSLHFAFETEPKHCYELTGKCLPFGTHAWGKNDPEFWLPHFKALGYDISFLLKG